MVPLCITQAAVTTSLAKKGIREGDVNAVVGAWRTSDLAMEIRLSSTSSELVAHSAVVTCPVEKSTFELFNKGMHAYEASKEGIEAAPPLILTTRGALVQCVFLECARLRAGEAAKLKLVSPRHHADVIAARLRVFEINGVVETSHQPEKVAVR